MADVASPAAGSAMSAVRSSRPTTPRGTAAAVDDATAAAIRAAAVRFHVAEERATKAEARVSQLEAQLAAAGIKPDPVPTPGSADADASSPREVKVRLEAVLQDKGAFARVQIASA